MAVSHRTRGACALADTPAQNHPPGFDADTVDAVVRVLFAEHERLLQLVMAGTDIAQLVQEDGLKLNFPAVRKATGERLRESIENRDQAIESLGWGWRLVEPDEEEDA